ncbi:hypothetical protein TRICI_005166 [Trichomonascus ciferrii]|uniref:NAD-dependent epimerase/dehydratase domain-containing protein n=1 Tax=Trichomonascus ciferrii TaxID=44093 RepID=A0A642UV57_9ASCO|nr:hypothetical protein TRICI_005166 [Trichomonascus ciferrii]
MGKTLITGAGGFLGQRLARAIVQNDAEANLVLTDVAAPPVPEGGRNVQTVGADLCHEAERLVTEDLTLVYVLHGIMSGGAEKDFDLGFQVNVEATRSLLNLCRERCPGVRLVFTSSTAVYGGELPDVITEKVMTVPQSSYGMEKSVCEFLVNDYTRRGFIDGRVIRYPTVIVRPGPPSSATSSFCSAIIREPLVGEKAYLPVSKSLAMWFGSVDNVVRNTLHAAAIPEDRLAKTNSRTINLPGMTVTVQEMLDALARVAGEDKLQYVEQKKDEFLERIVTSWPSHFDTSKADQLGFAPDPGLEAAIKAYIDSM